MLPKPILDYAVQFMDRHVADMLKATCSELYSAIPKSPHKLNLAVYAVNKNAPTLLKYSHDLGYPLDRPLFIRAINKKAADCLQYLIENRTGDIFDFACSQAARADTLECLKILYYNGAYWDEKTTRHAAKAGSLSCLKFAAENGCPIDGRAVDYAAKTGAMDCIEYLVNKGCILSSSFMVNATKSGSAECIKYALKAGINFNNVDIADYNQGLFTNIVESDSIECIELALGYNCPINEQFGKKIKSMPMLKYLYEHVGISDIHAFGYSCAAHGAAIAGSLEMLKFTIEAGCDIYLADLYAANAGALDCLKYLHDPTKMDEIVTEWGASLLENDNEFGIWNDSTKPKAPEANLLACLEFATEMNYPKSDNTCNIAAIWGLFDCLKYANEHEYHYNEELTEYAAHGGNVKCLAYAHEVMNVELDECLYNSAVINDSVECFRYLQKHEIPWPDGDLITRMIKYQAHNCLRYDIIYGCPISSTDMSHIISYDSSLQVFLDKRIN